MEKQIQTLFFKFFLKSLLVLKQFLLEFFHLTREALNLILCIVQFTLDGRRLLFRASVVFLGSLEPTSDVVKFFRMRCLMKMAKMTFNFTAEFAEVSKTRVISGQRVRNQKKSQKSASQILMMRDARIYSENSFDVLDSFIVFLSKRNHDDTPGKIGR